MVNSISRRRLLATSSQVAAASLLGGQLSCSSRPRAASPAILANRPKLPCGISSGDVTADSAVIWSRCDRPAKMLVEWSTTESFKDFQTAAGSDALPSTGLTARLELANLPPNQRIFYRVAFLDGSSPNVSSEPLVGTFHTAPLAARDLRIAWSGDTCGQGWGINPEWGGLKIYEQIRRLSPDFFIHSGDTIYADQPIKPEVKLPDGSIWRNITTAAKSKVAQTLEDYRGNFAYNLMDENLRRFNASIPILYQWDDHEVHNNWSPGETPASSPYGVKDIAALSAHARRAFLEFTTIRHNGNEPGRIYRSFSYGPLLDVFMLDERSYRGTNNPGRQTILTPDAAFMGSPQIEWLKQSLLASKATWKLIASDMPLSVVVKDAKNTYDAVAQGDKGAPLGRELEIAGLLSFCRKNAIRNLVWITTDIHHALCLHYSPERAAFKEFDPFWEFISGPLHAGSTGPGSIDPTFGPEMKFRLTAPRGNLGPAAGYQFFGVIDVDAKSQTMRVSQRNLAGETVYSVEIPPVLA